jgi:hypothetical protein
MIRQKDAGFQKVSENTLHNEVAILRLLNGDPIGGVQIPKLTLEPELLPGGDFYAAYGMTKVPGAASRWNRGSGAASADAAQDKRHFEQVGALLAQFHERAATLDIDGAGIRTTRHWTDHIEYLPELGDEINDAFTKIRTYYDANKRERIIHGDFHGGNVLTDASGDIASLIDFAEVKRSDNFMIDTLNIPDAGFPHFKKAYELESGDVIDPLMATMVAIHGNAAYLKHLGPSPSEDRDKSLQNLYENMNKVKSVTGYTPPGF